MEAIRMRLEGIHHITAITADAQRNLRLPAQHEHLRDELEQVLTPLEGTRPREVAR